MRKKGDEEIRAESIKPIKDIGYLERLINEGYILKGPRQDFSKNLGIIKRILRRGHELIPEDWLISRGYELVEPSTFTKGLKLAYKLTEGIIEQYFRSNYSLSKKNSEIPLYLKYEDQRRPRTYTPNERA